MKKMREVQSVVFHFCEKEYMLGEEVGTKGIDGEEKRDRHSDSDPSYGDSEEDDCHEN